MCLATEPSFVEGRSRPILQGYAQEAIHKIPDVMSGGKGCPDEILAVEVNFAILGTDIRLSAPVLIETEKGGYANAIADLSKFCERSISSEQKSYLEIPMIVLGGDTYKKLKGQERQLTARFHLAQVPKRMVV